MTNKSIVIILVLTLTALLLSTLNSAQTKYSDYLPTSQEKYYLNELADHSNQLIQFAFWSQKGSAWIEVPSSMGRKYSESRDLAESCAKYLNKALGYMVCVHIYYGDLHEITSKCK
jgi:hypothetical protein